MIDTSNLKIFNTNLTDAQRDSMWSELSDLYDRTDKTQILVEAFSAYIDTDESVRDSYLSVSSFLCKKYVSTYIKNTDASNRRYYVRRLKDVIERAHNSVDIDLPLWFEKLESVTTDDFKSFLIDIMTSSDALSELKKSLFRWSLEYYNVKFILPEQDRLYSMSDSLKHTILDVLCEYMSYSKTDFDYSTRKLNNYEMVSWYTQLLLTLDRRDFERYSLPVLTELNESGTIFGQIQTQRQIELIGISIFGEDKFFEHYERAKLLGVCGSAEYWVSVMPSNNLNVDTLALPTV